MNAISTLTVLPQSKEELKNYVDLVKSDILGGYINPIESAILLKSLEEIVKELKQDQEIKEYINDEANKYHEKTIEINGHKVSKSLRSTYDFSNCQDSVWDELKDKETQVKAALKGREGWLKTLKESKPDQETGELIYPPAIKQNEIISITLKKK